MGYEGWFEKKLPTDLSASPPIQFDPTSGQVQTRLDQFRLVGCPPATRDAPAHPQQVRAAPQSQGAGGEGTATHKQKRSNRCQSHLL